MRFFWIFFCLLLSGISLAQNSPLDSTFRDGPYIFYAGDQLVARYAVWGELREDTLAPGASFQIGPEVSPAFDARYVKRDAVFRPGPADFSGVGKLVAISDIHGQYELMAELLRTHGVIDDAGDWAFGDGHLVVNGDIFDRGDGVTDAIWLVYKLEQQAAMAGGKVHYLLGNHEIMNLKNDLRYVNKKYRYTTALLRTPYPALFGPETYLGRWIRTKPAVISINDMVFVHAGLSITCLNLGLSFDEINEAFQERIIDLPEEQIEADSVLRVLYGISGPIWYRGYFSKDFTKAQARLLLKRLKKKHIIVGHTPFPQIVSLFKRRIIGVDSTIQSGIDGEVLIYEAGHFFRGLRNGERVPL